MMPPMIPPATAPNGHPIPYAVELVPPPAPAAIPHPTAPPIMVPAIAPLTVPSCLACDIAQPETISAIAHTRPNFPAHPVIASILLPLIAVAASRCGGFTFDERCQGNCLRDGRGGLHTGALSACRASPEHVTLHWQNEILTAARRQWPRWVRPRKPVPCH